MIRERRARRGAIPRAALRFRTGARCALGGLALAGAVCACGVHTSPNAPVEPPPQPAAPAPPPAPVGPFPPEGPVSLAPQPVPESGLFYRVQSTYDGQSEALRVGSTAEPLLVSESVDVEIYYQEIPAPGSLEDELDSLLVLKAMRHRQKKGPPLKQDELELADDRLRTLGGEKMKPVLDLRGAQPKGEITPRLLLERPFELLRRDSTGNPIAVILRGTPPAQRFLRGLDLAPPIAWTRFAAPREAILPGTHWKMRRFPPNPVGDLGLELEIDAELMSYQILDDVPCAWLRLRGEVDQPDYPSAKGFRFDRVVAKVAGEAWVELGTSFVHKMVIEDDVRASYSRGEGSLKAEERFRYRGRTELRRLQELPTRWADGSEHFEVH